MNIDPIDVSPTTAGKMLEAIKMLCGVIEGYPDIDGYPDVKSCRMTAHALVDQVVSEADDRKSDLEQRYPTYPPYLIKACEDPFQYAVKLKTGEMWYIEEAKPINEEWVHLIPMPLESFDYIEQVDESPRPKFDRGVDVRVSDIVWIADAPHGS